MLNKTRRALVASVAVCSLALTACSNTAENARENADSAKSEVQSEAANATSAAGDAESNEITVTDNYGEKTVPHPPKRAAATDNRAFELLADWGVDLVAAPLKLMPDTLEDTYNKDTVEGDMGMHREPDLEALVAAEPDVVINGQRFSQYQEDIEKLVPDTPVVDFTPRDDEDFAAELIRQTEELGKIFDKESEAKQLVDDFNKALDRARDAYDSDKKVMALNSSGGELGYVAPSKGRTWGPLFDLVGMTPALKVDNATDDHEGDDVSVEAIADSNPDYILVLDRDAAIKSGEPDFKPAKDVIENNAALKNVTAVQKGNIVYAPEDTYTNENIITYTEILNSMADAFKGQS